MSVNNERIRAVNAWLHSGSNNRRDFQRSADLWGHIEMLDKSNSFPIGLSKEVADEIWRRCFVNLKVNHE